METLLSLILNIVILLCIAYLTIYLNSKAKNQADKEDLRKITEIVESVRKRNFEELETIKASLAVVNDKQIQIFSEEKHAIISFYSQLNKWIWEDINMYLNEYNYTNLQDISNRLIKIRDDWKQTNITFAKVQLLVKEEALINQGHKAIVETLKLHHFREDLLQRFKIELSIGKTNSDRILSNPKLLDDEEERSFYINQGRINEKNKQAILNDFFSNNNKLFTMAIVEVNEFRDIAKSYLIRP